MNKQTKRSLKLYDNLTSKQKAILALECMGQNDFEESDRIHATVPLKQYTTADPVYLTWLRRFHDVASFVGSIYLFEVLLLQRAQFGLVVTSIVDNGKYIPEADAEISACLARLAALRCAILTIRETHGIDVENITGPISIEWSPFWESEPDKEYQSQLTESLLACLGG